MKVRFTKIDPTRHTFEIIRTDGSAESSLLETRSFMPHDLIHFAYESVAGKQESFFGLLASGTTFAEFENREIMSDPALVDSEMIETELITGPLASYLTKGVSEEAFIAGLMNIFEARGKEAPSFIDLEFLARLKERYRQLIGQWNSLPHHAVMEIAWEEN